ncbi:MAG: hypothetical protein IKP68_05100 [Clostridia bacterium]|nr:hypothetical protein [Clostridia bacterium]
MKKTDICAICGRRAELSYDHIPPKCCGNNGDSYFISFTPKYLGKGAKEKNMHSQNGIKIQSICHECNNKLGELYDKDLGRFREFVIAAMKNDRPQIEFDLKKVIMGVIGHLLAASEFDPSIPAKAMREYYFGISDKLIKSYSLFCCYYPYEKNIFILKNYVPLSFGINEIKPEGMLSSFYFFPFVFILADKQKSSFKNDLFNSLVEPSLLIFGQDDWRNRGPTWPAVVDDHHGIVLSKSCENSVFKYSKK